MKSRLLNHAGDFRPGDQNRLGGARNNCSCLCDPVDCAAGGDARWANSRTSHWHGAFSHAHIGRARPISNFHGRTRQWPCAKAQAAINFATVGRLLVQFWVTDDPSKHQPSDNLMRAFSSVSIR
jgi:hypothetical protein